MLRRLIGVTLTLALTGSMGCDDLPPAAARSARADGRQAAPSPGPRAAPAEEPAGEEPEVGPPRPELPKAAGIHYLEIITGDASKEDRLPMIVAIHGLGDDPFGFVSLISDFPEPARIILPRAIHPHRPGFAWFRRRARDPDVRALSRSVRRAADRLAPAIWFLKERRPTVGKPIVTGFSQGGILAFTLSTRYPKLFSAAVPVGGWLPPPLWPRKDAPREAPPIVAIHGQKDPAVRFEPTRKAVEHLRSRGYPVELVAFPQVRHAIPPPVRIELHARLQQALKRIETGAETDREARPAQ